MLKELELLSGPLYAGHDCGHDWLHVRRVLRTALFLCRKEGGADEEIVAAAVLFHDAIMYPKDSAMSGQSSSESAKLVTHILDYIRFPKLKIPAVAYCIEAHSYSKGIVPKTLEARIVQDADRLDALGAIGVARTFAVGALLGGRGGRPFYSEEDPFCCSHTPDDAAYNLDHFYKKLLLLENKLNTKSAKAIAHRRTEFMRKYLKEFERELGGKS
jgi:uncharacterized protein